MNVDLQSWKPGNVIDGLYQIQEVIGVGGMGVVFRVSHREWNIDLAVKMPLPNVLERGDYRERFVREAETWIDLGVHPNIVQCWFVREYQGVPALFLDYLTGGSLKQWMDQKYIMPGQWGRILDLVIQAADGLAYSHSRGVVHRDVKPANLLVRGDDCLCVTDFGIVKTIGETHTALLGTPEYGAPEQWLRDASLGPAVDIYALGVVLYELATGRRPFLGEGKDRESALLLIKRHQNEAPPPPMSVAPGLPGPLNDLILRCLAKEPERRPDGMLELRELLTQVFQRITGEVYPRAVPSAGVQRADALNNRAVSLWYLNKREEAFAAWEQALQIDAQHHETLYNRSLLEWRWGQIDEAEMERRLKLARAYFQLGLFLTECGKPEQASGALEQALKAPAVAAQGPPHRALGDALMYQDSFFAAERAYGAALERMPDDEGSLLRRRMARIGKGGLEGRIYFPKDVPRVTLQLEGEPQSLLVDPHTTTVAIAGEGWLEMWDPLKARRLWRRDTEAPAGSMKVDSVRLFCCSPQQFRAYRSVDGHLEWELPAGERCLALNLQARLALVVGRQPKVLKLSDWQPLRVYPAQVSPFRCAAFTDNGERMMTGSSGGSLTVWDTEYGEELRTFQAHSEPIQQLLLCRGARMAITVSKSEPVRFWDLVKGKKLVELSDSAWAEEIVLDPLERFLVLRAHERFTVWELGGSAIYHGSGPHHIDKYGNLLCEGDGCLILWSLSEHRRLRRWRPHQQKLTQISTFADGVYALTASQEGQLQIWEHDQQHRVLEGALLVNRSHSHTEGELTRRTFEEFLERAREHLSGGSPGLAYRDLTRARNVSGYARDGEAMSFLAELAQFLARHRLADMWERRSLDLESRPLEIVANLERNRAYLLDESGRVSEYGIDEGVLLGHLPIQQRVTAMHHDLAGHRLVLGCEDGILISYQVDSGPGATLALGSPVQKVQADSSGRFAAVATVDGRLHLLDVDEQNHLRQFEDQKDASRVLKATHNLSLGLSGPYFRLWDLPNANCRLESRGLKPEGRDDKVALTVAAAALTRDGEYALTAGLDFMLRLWHTASGKGCRLLAGHSKKVTFLSIMTALQVAVSASEDGFLRLWDLADGSTLKEMTPHSGPILAGWAAPDGRYLVTAGEKTLRVWELDWELNPDKAPVPLDEVYGHNKSFLGSLFRRR